MEGEERNNNLNDLRERLNQLEDLQRIADLDMINLKNELEGMKLVSPSPLSIEDEKRIEQLKNVSKNVNLFRKWKETVNEVRFLRSKVMKGVPYQPPESKGKVPVPVPQESLRKIEFEMEKMKRDLFLLKRAKELSLPPPERMGKIKSRIQSLGAEQLRQNMTAKMEEMEARLRDMLQGEIRNILEMEMRNLKSGKAPEKGGEEIRGKVKRMEGEIGRIGESLRKISERKPDLAPRKGMEKFMDDLSSKIEEILKRLDKDESYMKSIFNDLNRISRSVKRPEAPGAPAGPPLPEELRDIRNTVVQNVDHIHDIEVDVRQLKDTINIAEKTGWIRGKPEMGELRDRIERLEDRLRRIHVSRPIIVE